MKRRFLVPVLVLALLIGASLACGSTDSARLPATSTPLPPPTRLPPSEEQVDDFAPGLLLFALLIMIAGLILVGIGIVLGVVILIVTAILLAFGIVSSSVLIGFIQRRPKYGFMAFLVQVGAVLGVPCGVAGLWLLKALTDLQFSLGQTTLYGAFCGLVGGAITGLVFGLALDQIYRWTSSRLRRVG